MAPSAGLGTAQFASQIHAESIVRGHKSGLLTVPDYNNLCQCETLDDIKLNLVRGNNVFMVLGAGACLRPELRLGAPPHRTDLH